MTNVFVSRSRSRDRVIVLDNAYSEHDDGTFPNRT